MVDAEYDEPQNLTAQMVSKLFLVAAQHGGQVPLHGRLFSQWLHYAFPYECPYPQLTYESEFHLPRLAIDAYSSEDIDAYVNASDRADEQHLAQKTFRDSYDPLSDWTMEE